jgi:hypothetical protein
VGSQVAQGLVRANGVVDFFSSPQLAIEFVHFQRARGELVELFGMGALARSTAPLSLGERGGNTNR